MTAAPVPKPPAAAAAGRSLVQIPLEDLHPHRNNVRSNAEHDLGELAESIRSVGVLQPLLVQRANGRFTIVDGHRRYYAAMLAGRRTVPCLPAAAVDFRTQVELMLASAMSARLKPVDMAKAFRTLRDDLALSVAEIARRTGYSQATVRDRLSLLALPVEAQRMLERGDLSNADAVELARQAIAQRSAAGNTRETTRETTRGGVVPAHRRPGWFTRTHPLAATVKATCTHNTERVMVGGIGCGQCWEHAITTAATQGRS